MPGTILTKSNFEEPVYKSEEVDFYNSPKSTIAAHFSGFFSTLLSSHRTFRADNECFNLCKISSFYIAT
jgi:hypothetical protein